jgi:hypothetical protein
VRREPVAFPAELDHAVVQVRSLAPKGLDGDARMHRCLGQRWEFGDLLLDAGGRRGESLSSRGGGLRESRHALREQLLFLVHRREIALGDRQTLRRVGDVGVHRLDLLVQERHLVRDLVQTGHPRAELLLGGTQVVGEDLELGEDLPEPNIGFLGRVDHGRADQETLRRDERCLRMLPLLPRRLLDVGDHVDVAEDRRDDPAHGRLGFDGR